MPLFNTDENALEAIRKLGEQSPETTSEEKTEQQESQTEEQSESTEKTEEQSEVVDGEKKEESTETTEQKTDEEKTEQAFVADPELLKEFANEGQTFASQQEFNTHILETAKKLKAESEKVLEVGRKLTKIGEDAPEFLAWINAIAAGKSGLEAIIEAGIADLIPSEGDYDFEGYKKAVAEKKEHSKKAAEQQKIVDNNIAESHKNITDFKAEHKLGEEFQNFIYGVVDKFMVGQMDKQTLDVFRKGLSYDAKVKELEEKAKTERAQGVIEGKNTKYEAEKTRKNSDVDIPEVTARSASKESDMVDEKELRLREKATSSIRF